MPQPIMSAVVLAMVMPLLVLYIAGRRKFSARPGEPPFVPYLIPWVGNILAGIFSYETFMADQAIKHSGGPFAFHILGRVMFCFSDPVIGTAFYRNQDLDWEGMVLPLIARAFNVPVYCLRYIDTNFMNPLFVRYFTSSEGAADLTQRFAGALENELKAWFKERGSLKEKESPSERTDLAGDKVSDLKNAVEEQTVELSEWIRRVMYRAGIRTLFGPGFPAEESEKMFWKVDEGIFKLFVGGEFLHPSEYEARRDYFRVIERYLGHGGAEESSKFVRHRERKHDEAGLQPDVRARLHFVTVWGFQSNAPLAAAWAVIHACHSPILLAALRVEIATARLPTATSSFNLLQTFHLESLVKLPLLGSLISEVLRTYLTAGSIRLCIRDTSITHPVTGETFLIRKGALAQLVLQHVNHNPNIHENEANFDAYRFLDKKKKAMDEKSKAWRIGQRPFGGGKGLCPGRIVAYNEIAIFVATVVWFFELGVASEDQNIPPALGVTRQGIQPPGGEYRVWMRARNMS